MKRSLPATLLLGLSGLFLLLLIGMPFWWVVTGSFKLPQEIIARVPTMVPHSFTLQHFAKLLSGSDYPVYMINSLLVAGISTAITLVLSVPAAYAFFRLAFPGREALYRIILLAYAFPSIVVLIPLFGMFARIGLIDTLAALVIINVTFALPFSIWMLRSFFASVPKEIEEAALMDGAPPTVILRRIMIPLIAPGIASVGIFAFISAWTEYVFASVLILSDAKRTVPVGFSGIIGQYQIDWGLLLSGASLAVLPVVILFALVGRWFVSGLTEGAVK
ncbi:carbohydrate ABC transporter permease [Metarhizobium album]|uniref:Maltose/maltodextrin transport system permease protein MalG n=1 Tax=Metarhizobium album TaxID=2182425 RepID=A0A2U2DKR4_9HYPH|nr:carbohydrate ABC transporter permease [Rhizobium album]PWE53883.1 carbohydrate ABC transporter permease [Rhizobium album]